MGELELSEKQKFSYLFDFGDMWWFNIQVLRIQDGRVERSAVLQEHNKAPEQYPYYEEDALYSSVDEDITVSEILDSVPDDLIEKEYAALLYYGEEGQGVRNVKEKRQEIERLIFQNTDRILIFMTTQMRKVLSGLLEEAEFEKDDWCTIVTLSSLGFCRPEDTGEILVPQSVKETCRPLLKRAAKLDRAEELSELIIRRCGVIEMEELYSAVQKHTKIKMTYEEYRTLIFGRLHFFGAYFFDCFDGKEMISCYEREETEQILGERRKPENAGYDYPPFADMDLGELKKMPQALEKWQEYIKFSLNIDWQTAGWLITEFPLLVSSGIMDRDGLLNVYKKVLSQAGSRMSKKAAGMIEKLMEEMPLAVRKGNTVQDTQKVSEAQAKMPAETETHRRKQEKNGDRKEDSGYKQLSLFD